MLPPKSHTSQSTENLLLKCQKETHKKCLPPEWSIHPPNKEILPPPETLALAIQIESSSPNRVNFFEADSNRPVGSIGAEYRGSIVVVPWRPGLKFVCVATCRRRSGCRVGVVREAKGIIRAARMSKDAAVVADAVAAQNAGVVKNTSSNSCLDVHNNRHSTTVSSANGGSSTRSRIPTLKGQRMSIKRCENSRHVSVNASKINGKKSRIPTRRAAVEQSC
ncbi:hypothetical protein M441DRAFT_151873 [Trichoderma asperellum CBS 433.97]|uniref:Uncharacterized protein n=1 Tax=Trichoderma asperellum (strain ATCC 204424 / CBS 433.97 / NBRC 101777) TaxID=1042311 RepID=A0A2T3YTR4_TRIA4|nr:hypothetical protein M441DRAFT_151873 [Trichoderma asperellum CBS 433.97]PTB35896.1 hypothetical protein M441DRAFT_151873 [Trichoderma asperellum CBS 433.97]